MLLSIAHYVFTLFLFDQIWMAVNKIVKLTGTCFHLSIQCVFKVVKLSFELMTFYPFLTNNNKKCDSKGTGMPMS